MSRIRWHLTAAAIAAAAVTFGIVAAPASGAASPTAEFQKTQDWGSGWTGKVTVRNGGSSALSSWAVEFDLPAGTSIPSAWDAALTKTGNHYKFTNLSWNGNVPAGGTASFGFNGSGSGSPSNCTLNGQACGGGTNPTSSSTTTTTTTTTRPTSSTTTTTSSSTTTTTSSSTTTTTTTGNPPPGDKLVGYFIQWGVYGRNFHVKNVDTSGSAAKLTHINYAFGNVQNGQCTIGDAYADYDKAYTAADSVDGVADNWDQPLRGNFNQLRKLKKKYPNLKVLWSFGGWTWSGGFGQASKNPAAFADSCYKLVEDPRWADVFDGIDIDWEYPNACGLTCDTSGPDSFKAVTQALRTKFGANNLITAATSADGADGGKLDVADYAGAVQYLDWVMPMTYDFFGAWDAKGPTNPHSPLTAYPGIPKDKWTTEGAINKFKSKGIPASKILLGVGFYGRGWTGVTQATPGGTATAAAPGTYEAGFEDYKVLKTKCPATGTIGGTAYAFCGGNWWGYDTPATVAGKRNWGKAQGLGGSFFWELSGDTSNGELITALRG
ncbi:glycosyl hydrolase family 18 protein [Actinokineospora cianjurensis]|uniref:chitinase n=1 Tax=Actinokineospora cianjurensis TaxID=585224 RepID=A0A421AWS1_9PSEU|nr:glycosyl hydrolase family 18 protein [Actinokineospora cianjurensis]RLK54244.1 chitinase (glycosyl hydrolase family 18) [Actinokineospora cianjurensis]